MKKSSPLNLCSGHNIEQNSPTLHIQTLWNRDMYMMDNQCLVYPRLPILIAHRTQQKKKASIFETNVFVPIKATEVIFKIQKFTEDNLVIKSCFHPILAPKVQNLLHC